MAKKRIFTVGFSVPGDEFEYIEFASNQTLLDADIILYEPTLGSIVSEKNYQSGGALLYSGVEVLTEHSSFAAKKQIDHWRSEIVDAVNAGKLVIVYLAAPIERLRYDGSKTYSGVGKSRVASLNVTSISSYDAIPNLTKVVAKSGVSIRLQKDAAYLATYWKEFSEYSPYEVEIEGKFNRILLASKTGNRTVGAAIHGSSSALLFLPPIRYDEDEFQREAGEGEDEFETYWTEIALQFGKRLLSALIGLSEVLKKDSQATAPPEWSKRSDYSLISEAGLQADIARCDAEFALLQAKKISLEVELERAAGLRQLLFEQGKRLECSVLEAMTILGFDSQQFADSESEFDGVFVSSEGRCLGEVEDRDSKAINIDKFSQLERNLQEDFSREEITEYATGVLFGNAFRLVPLEDREDFFTVKCLSAAKRVGAVLLRTPDLFIPARYLKQNPHDKSYAQKCRESIFGAAGGIVTFPMPPPFNDRET